MQVRRARCARPARCMSALDMHVRFDSGRQGGQTPLGTGEITGGSLGDDFGNLEGGQAPPGTGGITGGSLGDHFGNLEGGQAPLGTGGIGDMHLYVKIVTQNNVFYIKTGPQIVTN